MAKLKRKFIKMRVEEECSMSRDELNASLDALIESQYRKNLNKLKGSPLCLWQHAGEDCYKLRYYHSYREDMCDTMMTIDVEKGMERCSVHGFIHKPPAIWACFWGVIASVFIDFLIISWLVLFGENFSLSGALMVSGAVCLVRIYICMALIELNRERVRKLREELYRVIRDKPEAIAEEDVFEENELVTEVETDDTGD
ncbi:MAG: hypothetical protein IK990_12880 [Ruminiclostridium sp.]|nr:hypothetical protein [Ruminiclostridium sp.]